MSSILSKLLGLFPKEIGLVGIILAILTFLDRFFNIIGKISSFVGEISSFVFGTDSEETDTTADIDTGDISVNIYNIYRGDIDEYDSEMKSRAAKGMDVSEISELANEIQDENKLADIVKNSNEFGNEEDSQRSSGGDSEEN